MLFLAKGIVLGLSIAAPIGPMALLCLRATLAHGFRAGWLGGLGVAAGDVFYAAVAAFGLQGAALLLAGGSRWLGLAGGLYLVWFGVSTMRRPLPEAGDAARRRHGLATFATTFLLTLANPPTIMIFAAMFASLGLAEGQGNAAALAVVAGVFLGSAGWWTLLAAIASRLRHRARGPVFLWINRLSGAALAGFGLWAGLNAMG